MVRAARLSFLGFVLVLVAGAASGPERVEEFLRRHWRAPLAPQGTPPERFSPVEASLLPESCGTCHPVQYADWRTSWHAAATGPGIAGQLVEMLETEPRSALGCLRCHAPLAEQAPLARGDDGGLVANPIFDAALHRQGLPCAGCHVRAHERFGPPRRDGTLASRAPRETRPHGGVTRTPAFLSAGFCRGCHQFEADGTALNGKPLENTYREWEQSRFARAGVQCQDCHMPDRRHRWRGIHDVEMVRSGVAIDVKAPSGRIRAGETANVALTLRNVKVGHAFPTYVTPKVVLRAELIDSAGAVVEGSRAERVIAREVALDLSREIADTRLLPGQAASLSYTPRVPGPGVSARLTVVVYPDAFYVGFYEVLLEQGAGRGAPQIRQALDAARRSSFEVFRREIPLS